MLVRKGLIERALDFNIILDDVALTELAFSPQYSAAVEAKQVAAQEAQRASFYVEKAIQQRQEKIVQAEGEAQAAKLVSLFVFILSDNRYCCCFHFIVANLNGLCVC